VPGVDWALVVDEPAGSMLAVNRAARESAFWVTLLAMVAAAVGGALAAGWLTAPLSALTRAAGSIAAGAPTAPLPRSRVPEIAQLSRAFAEMRDRLVARTEERRGVQDALVRLSHQRELILASAGEGIFGADGSPTEDDQSGTLDPHRGLGFFLTNPIAALLLIVALLAWLPNKRNRVLSIALPFILFIQMILADAGRWGGAFHPLNAFLILGILGYLSKELWRPRAEPIAAV